MPFDPDRLEEHTNKHDYDEEVAKASQQEWEAYVEKLLSQMMRGLENGLDDAQFNAADVQRFRDKYKQSFLTILKDYGFQVTRRRRKYLRNTGRDMGIVAAINANAEAGFPVTFENLRAGHKIVMNRRAPLQEVKEKLRESDEAPPPQPYCTPG